MAVAGGRGLDHTQGELRGPDLEWTRLCPRAANPTLEWRFLHSASRRRNGRGPRDRAGGEDVDHGRHERRVARHTPSCREHRCLDRHDPAVLPDAEAHRLCGRLALCDDAVDALEQRPSSGPARDLQPVHAAMALDCQPPHGVTRWRGPPDLEGQLRRSSQHESHDDPVANRVSPPSESRWADTDDRQKESAPGSGWNRKRSTRRGGRR